MRAIPLLTTALRSALGARLRFVIIAAATAMIAVMCAMVTVILLTTLDWVDASVEPQDEHIGVLMGAGLTASTAYSLLNVQDVLAVVLEVPGVTVTAGETAVTVTGKLFTEGYLTARKRELIAGSLKPPTHGQPYCDLGLNAARELFNTPAAAVGQMVDIEGVAHEVRVVIGRDLSTRGPRAKPESDWRFRVDELRLNDVAAFPLDPAWQHPATRLLIVADPGRSPFSVAKGALFFLFEQGHDPHDVMLGPVAHRARGQSAVWRLGRVLIIQSLLAVTVTVLNMLAFCLYWSHDRRGEAAIHAALGCSPLQARLSAACEVLAPAVAGWLIGTAFAVIRYTLFGGNVKVPMMLPGTLPPPEFILTAAMRGAVIGAVAVGICVAIALGRQAARVSPAELLRTAR